MMAWSVKPGQAYLSREGIKKIKSVLTNDIFKLEMLHAYEQKSVSRDELVRQARETMKVLVNVLLGPGQWTPQQQNRAAETMGNFMAQVM